MKTPLLLLALLAFATAPGAARAGEYDLVIDETAVNLTGHAARAMTINGQLPGPTLHWREGEEVTIRVTNRLDEPASLHWHGILVPADMDGVPGLSFPGIAPGKTFTYRFTVRQSGTYWYHSHSGMQEQSGVYAPLVIAPAAAPAERWDRDQVVMLSDWTDEDPHRVLAKLKKRSGYYNVQKRTLGDFLRDGGEEGLGTALADRLAWGRMRMDPTDIADVTGATYTYLVNGKPPAANWTALFTPGERVRLRFINGAAMTYFDVRIPGLKMTVVAADGQDIQPVAVDEFRIAVAETYDVIVEPTEARAYTIFAETMDRSGYARATLAPEPGMEGPIPPRRERPLLTMADMGMAHQVGMGEEANRIPDSMSGMDHGGHAMAGMAHGDMAGMGHDKAAPAMWRHGPDHHGPGNESVAEMATRRLGDPGPGLRDAPHRVLVYADLRGRQARDIRPPGREIELHLTGNMKRFMWSFDGVEFTDSEPIVLRYGERVRFTLVNDTMMNHPIHLHGMWSELDNGSGRFTPRKHTINVKPGEIVSFDVDADAMGNWAFHCHLLYHMDTGMFRTVTVVPAVAETQ